MAKITFRQNYTNISDLNTSMIGNEVTINGWIRNTRIQQTLAFLELHDGSSSKTIQIITEDNAYINLINSLSIGSAISINGTVVKHPQKDDQVEIKLLEIKYYSSVENPKEYILNAKEKAFFLSNTYPDIFNRLIKNELNILILSKLLDILKLIEDGEVDQHEGSALVGKLLKTLYLDSAVKRGENLDKEHESEKIQPVEGKKISWNQFKNMK